MVGKICHVQLTWVGILTQLIPHGMVVKGWARVRGCFHPRKGITRWCQCCVSPACEFKSWSPTEDFSDSIMCLPSWLQFLSHPLGVSPWHCRSYWNLFLFLLSLQPEKRLKLVIFWYPFTTFSPDLSDYVTAESNTPLRVSDAIRAEAEKGLPGDGLCVLAWNRLSRELTCTIALCAAAQLQQLCH